MWGQKVQLLFSSHWIIIDWKYSKVTDKSSGDLEPANGARWLYDAYKLDALADADELKIMIVKTLMGD